jgi:ABC-type antimicrobial peptide transport system permease subunit
MKIGDLTELATQNLREAMLRNSLTTLGIAVGVASLVAMLSLGVGLQELINRRLERNGLFDTVLVRPRTSFNATGEIRRNRDLGAGRANDRTADGNENDRNSSPTRRDPPDSDIISKPLDQDARRELAQLPHVLEVYPEFRFTGDFRFGEAGHLTQVTSLPASASTSDGLEGMQGRFFSAPDSHEVILQADVAADLADSQHLQPAEMLGKELVLRYAGREPLPAPSTSSAARERAANPDDAAFGFSIISSRISLRVIGIVDAETVASGANAFGRSGAYVPLAVAEELGVVQGNDMGEVVRESVLGGNGRHYTNLTIRVERPADVPIVEDSVRQMGYAPFSLLDLTRNLRRLFAILDLLLGIFGSLALAVASLGIINTLVMAILERRREIGVLKALGASDKDVRQLFFAEAGVMGLVGGVAGVALGWGIGHVIQLGTNYYLRQQQIPPENIWTVPVWLVAAAIVFSLAVSLGAGLYPASRAARLDPVDALRYE